MNNNRFNHPTNTASRWHVIITYNTNIYRTEEFDLEEIEDLQDILEDGADWRFIEDVVITYNFRNL